MAERKEMDKRAFGELIMANEVQLYRIAKSILKQDEDCEDAAQEAVTKAFEHLETLQNDRYAKTWLIRILINVCYDLAEKRKRQQVFEEEKYRREEQRIDYRDLYEALFLLEGENRLVLVLHYLEGFQVKEISEMLGIPEGTVKSRLYRGREKLKKILTEEE